MPRERPNSTLIFLFSVVLAFTAGLSGCKKLDLTPKPFIGETSVEVNDVSGAVVARSFLDGFDGEVASPGREIADHGHLWSLNPDPEIPAADLRNPFSDSTSLGAIATEKTVGVINFQSQLHRLMGNATYYVRPYVTFLHAGQQTYDIEIGDWSGNGRTDIVACFYSDTNNPAAADIIAFENPADGFVATPLLYDDERTTALRLADLDGDKDLDVVYAQHHIAFGGLYTALNQDGDLVGAREITYGNGQRFESYGIDIVDVNADGAVDILYADQGNANLVLLNGEAEVTSTTDGMILEQTQIRLYPNPAAGKATVQWFFDDDRPVSYQLFDVNGRMMQGASRLNVSGEVFEAPLQNLPEGAYFLRVITREGRVAVAKLLRGGD
jgi:hypothetical protein